MTPQTPHRTSLRTAADTNFDSHPDLDLIGGHNQSPPIYNDINHFIGEPYIDGVTILLYPPLSPMSNTIKENRIWIIENESII